MTISNKDIDDVMHVPQRKEDRYIVVDVSNCARCGHRHRNLSFKRLTIPMIQEYLGNVAYTHFCICPQNHEPLLMRVTIKDGEGVRAV